MTNTSQEHALLQDRYALRITARLSGGLDTLPHDVSERLRASRMQALARRKAVRVQPAFSLALAGFGSVGSGDGERIGFWGRLASSLPVIALAAGLVAINVVQSERRALEIAEVDAAILTDDLPPSAYVDPGFVQFLKAGGN